MADEGNDVLRMRATLEDETQGTLAQIRRNMQAVGRGVDTSKSRKELVELKEQLKGAADHLSGGLIPAMGRFRFSAVGFALGAVAVVTSLAGISKELKEFSERNADAKFAARSLGLTAQELKAFQRAAAEVRIDPSAALLSLRTSTQSPA